MGEKSKKQLAAVANLKTEIESIIRVLGRNRTYINGLGRHCSIR